MRSYWIINNKSKNEDRTPLTPFKPTRMETSDGHCQQLKLTCVCVCVCVNYNGQSIGPVSSQEYQKPSITLLELCFSQPDMNQMS